MHSYEMCYVIHVDDVCGVAFFQLEQYEAAVETYLSGLENDPTK
jgi:hypothetical protein